MEANDSICGYTPDQSFIENLPLIHAEQLSCELGTQPRVQAVKQVSFDIQEKQITAIIGESGSGKSTLLRLIYGLLSPSHGEVRYRGLLVPKPEDRLIPGHPAMRLVSQGFDDLNTYAKVWDNIASQLSNTNLALKNSRTQEVLEQLHIDHLAQKRVADLSGGEKQRVAICRALINEPEVLLMDEPFNQVDAAFRDQLQYDIQEIVQKTGLTVVLVSHDPAEVLAMAEHLIVMKSGNIVDQGPAESLYFAPESAYTARLLAKSNILQASQASSLGIDSSHALAIHQDWLKVEAAPKEGKFEIKKQRFRGFYWELIVGNEQFDLHVMDFSPTRLPLGTKVSLKVEQFHQLQRD